MGSITIKVNIYFYKSHNQSQQKIHMCKKCKIGQALINLLQIKLQQKSATIFTKVTNGDNKNPYVCKHCKSGQAIINFL
jgi:protein-arginine kinase activator protein McsA